MTARARFLFTTFEGGGHVSPPLIVAGKLKARGHAVLILSDVVNAPMAAARGLDFTPWRLAPNRTRLGDPAGLNDWGTRWPPEILRRLCNSVITGPAQAYARDTAEIADQFAPDVIITNELLMGSMIAAEARGTPLALLTSNAWCYPTRQDVPPFGPGFNLARSAVDRSRDRWVSEATGRMYDSGLGDLNAARRACGLTPVARVLDQLDAVDRILLGFSQAFDFDRPASPEGFSYVGPLIAAPSWAEKGPSGRPASISSRPRVLVSFGTTFQNQKPAIQRCMRALATLPYDGIVTLGPAVTAEGLPSSANVTVFGSASHDQLVPGCAAVVCHGGHGTLLRPLIHGVPVLCLPMGRDHADNAARLRWHRAGLRLDIRARPVQIASAVRRLVEEPRWGEAARKLGHRMAAEADGGVKAARLLEVLASGPTGEPRSISVPAMSVREAWGWQPAASRSRAVDQTAPEFEKVRKQLLMAGTRSPRASSTTSGPISDGWGRVSGSSPG